MIIHVQLVLSLLFATRDSKPVKPLLNKPGIELLVGWLISGSMYVCFISYPNDSSAFTLNQGFNGIKCRIAYPIMRLFCELNRHLDWHILQTVSP